MFKIGNITIPHRLLMAPMCGITHKAFRRVLKRFGAGYVATQMVSAKALTMGDKKSRHLLSYDESERPIVFQIFGNDADTLAEAAKIAQDMGPDIIDLNMGCPAKKIVNDGGGSALLRDTLKARDVLSKMRAALRIPFTIKVRAGWDKCHTETLEIAKIAEECGVDAITMHARTKTQGYKGQADWNLIGELKEHVKIPVIGNGDITRFEQVDEMIQKTGCDGVMIGRAAITEPWFFRNYLEQKESLPTIEEIKEIIYDQYESFFEFFGVKNGIKNMRKHLCAYTKGLRNGSQFRNKIITISEWELLKKEIDAFFM
ncbi:MAG: tRNA dihydrouridine synthase DusB [Deltaproteobacteria bacterium GWA2_45_12]|nr:MAG: tRNA dihydrouridine synthase DusB [Deltaproteobacteria bacterium GWA2_45_12]